MTKKITVTKSSWVVAIAAVFVLAMIPSASAQGDLIKTNIPFAFHVGAKTLPAGPYEFRLDFEVGSLSLVGPKGSDAIAFVTELAPAQHSSETDSHIIFDKVGTNYTLSEVWESGMDGVLVYATKGKHEHEVIHAKK